MSVSRHAAYNLLGTAAPIFVALVSIPAYIGLIGEQRYAVLSIAWLLLGYFGVFDLGIGRAAAQRIARLAKSPQAEKALAFWTAFALNSTLGIVGGLILWPAAMYFFSQKFQVDEIFRPEIIGSLPWLMLALPLSTVTSVLSGALQGVEKFISLNVINATGSILFQTVPLFIAWIWTPDLGVLMPAAIAARLLGVLLLYWACMKHVTKGAGFKVGKQEVKQLLKFGGWISVSSLISPIMVMADRFIIGAILGAKSVTLYSVPYQLAERTAIIPNALSSSLFPRFARDGIKDESELAITSTRILVVVMTPMILMGILLSPWFLSIWISPEFSQHSTLILQILLIGFWVNGLARIPHAKLQASGRPEIVAICHLIEVIPYLGILYFSLHSFGVMGAAIAFTCRVAVDYILLSNQARTLRATAVLTNAGLVLLLAALYLSNQVANSNMIHGAQIALLLALTIAWAAFFAPPIAKKKAKNLFARILPN